MEQILLTSPVIKITDKTGMIYYINWKEPDDARRTFEKLQT